MSFWTMIESPTASQTVDKINHKVSNPIKTNAQKKSTKKTGAKALKFNSQKKLINTAKKSNTTKPMKRKVSKQPVNGSKDHSTPMAACKRKKISSPPEHTMKVVEPKFPPPSDSDSDSESSSDYSFESDNASVVTITERETDSDYETDSDHETDLENETDSDSETCKENHNGNKEAMLPQTTIKKLKKPYDDCVQWVLETMWQLEEMNGEKDELGIAFCIRLCANHSRNLTHDLTSDMAKKFVEFFWSDHVLQHRTKPSVNFKSKIDGFKLIMRSAIKIVKANTTNNQQHVFANLVQNHIVKLLDNYRDLATQEIEKLQNFVALTKF